MSSQVAKAARRVTHELHGVVVSAGLMQKTVKVRVGGQKWNKIVNKVSERLQIAVHYMCSGISCAILLYVVLTNLHSGSLTLSTT